MAILPTLGGKLVLGMAGRVCMGRGEWPVSTYMFFVCLLAEVTYTCTSMQCNTNEKKEMKTNTYQCRTGSLLFLYYGVENLF